MIPSPTHSLKVESTPTPKRIITRRNRSTGSINSLRSTILATGAENERAQNLLTPLCTPRSFLSDSTNIEEPRKKSWWKRLGENTIQNLSLLHENPIKEMDDILNDYEQVDHNCQENRNFDLGLPDSSSNETIESIVIPQRRLFNQKENVLQSKFENVVEKENFMSNQLQSQSEDHDKQATAQTAKTQKNVPVFPSALLNMSTNVTNKSQELPNLEQKAQPKYLFSNRSTHKKKVFTNLKLIESEDESLHFESKVKPKNLFGNCVRNTKNNRFSGLIAVESDDEIPSIQPKVFGFQKPSNKRKSSLFQGDAISPSLSSASDADFNNWKMLPSSTMVDDNLSEKSTPAKKLRLTRASYINNESRKSSDTKPPPSVPICSPETSDTTKVNEESHGMDNQVTKYGSQMHLTDKNEVSIAVSKDDLIQLGKNNSEAIAETKHSEIDKQNIVTKYDDECSGINKNNAIVPTTNKSKSIEKEDVNTTINKEKVNVNDSILPSNPKEDSNGILKVDEGESTNENKQSKIHNSYNGVADNTKTNFITEKEALNTTGIPYNITNDTVPNLVIEKNTRNNCTDMEKLPNNEEIQKFQQSDKDIKILANDKSVMNSNDNLHKSKQKDVKNTLENSSQTTLPRENEEIKENANYNEAISLSGNGKNPLEKELHIEDINISESVLQDEISETEQFEKESQTLSQKENSSMEYNTDSPALINSDGDDGKFAVKDVNNRTCNDIGLEHGCKENSSESKSNSNNSIIVDQTPEDINEVSKHDNSDRNKLDTSKIKSPEAVLNDVTHNYLLKTLPNLSNRRNTNFIERATLRPSFFSMKDSLDLHNDGSRNSSAEGSGWDSHRTTRRTLRQTFGKDFTFRKSLRTLVMEKSAKGHMNVEDNVRPDFQNTVDQINSVSLEKSIEHINPHTDINVSINKEFTKPIEFAEENKSAKRNETLDKEELPRDSNTTDKHLNITSTNEDVILQYNQNNYSQKNRSQENKLEKVNQSVLEYFTNINEFFDDNEPIEEDMAAAENKREEGIDPTDQNEVTDRDGSVVQNPSDSKDEAGKENSNDIQNASDSGNEAEKENVSNDENETAERTDSPIENESADEQENDPESENESIEENETTEEIDAESENEFTMERSINEDKTKDVESVLENMSDDEENEYGGENELITDDESADENEHLEENEDSEEHESGNECVSKASFVNRNESREENEKSNEKLYRAESKSKSNDIKTKQKQTLLIQYMEKIKENNMKRNNLIREKILEDLKAPVRDSRGIGLNRPKLVKSNKIVIGPPKRATQIRPTPFGIPPKELLEDLNYKPRKPFKPRNASWINKRLYKFLESKLEPKYDYRAQHRSEKFATYLYKFTQEFKRDKVYPNEAIKQLKREMAQLNIVETHYDFYVFCREFLPKEIRIKIIPDIVNKLPLPRRGVYSEILVNQQ